MAYLEELLPAFRNGAKIRRKCWEDGLFNTIGGRSGFYYTLEDINANDWKLYLEPVEWDDVIKSKCLCWFWEEGFYKYRIAAELLEAKNKNYPLFRASDGQDYDCCYPICRDEVTFYEDRKDE